MDTHFVGMEGKMKRSQSLITYLYTNEHDYEYEIITN